MVVFSRSPRDPIYHVKQVLPLLRHVEVTLKLKKGIFFTGTVDRFGRVTGRRRLKIATYTTAAIKILKPQKYNTELCLFLELNNVFRRYLLNLFR